MVGCPTFFGLDSQQLPPVEPLVVSVSGQQGQNFFVFHFNMDMQPLSLNPTPANFVITVNGAPFNPIIMSHQLWLSPSSVKIAFLPPISPLFGDSVVVSMIAPETAWLSAADGTPCQAWGPLGFVV